MARGHKFKIKLIQSNEFWKTKHIQKQQNWSYVDVRKINHTGKKDERNKPLMSEDYWLML